MNPNLNWSHVASRGVSVQVAGSLSRGGRSMSRGDVSVRETPQGTVTSGRLHPNGMFSWYRPQRSCGKVMFLHLSVILFTGGVWQTPPSNRRPLQRTVRILLECIILSFQIVLLCRDRRKGRYLQRCICLLYSDMSRTDGHSDMILTVLHLFVILGLVDTRT